MSARSTHLAGPRRRPRALAVAAAAGLVAAALPLAASAPAQADDEAPSATFGGYVATTSATPLRIEIYEPALPIPAEPQLEMKVMYTKAYSDSGTSTGRASYLWPGDPMGEGIKTFFEQLGLPSDLVKDGYPVQVNSAYPAEPATMADEPMPGLVMRTSSKEGSATASGGFSSDSDVQPKAEQPSSGSGNPLKDLIDQLAGGLSKGVGGGVPAAEPGGDIPGLPPELALLVDLDGFTASSSATSSGGKVTATSRSNLGEVKLLSGLITISGVDLRSTSTSDGTKGTNKTTADYGTLTLAGQKFGLGPDGIEAQGKKVAIPGLSSDPLKALAQLGVRILMPTPTRTVEGDQASASAEGLRIEIETELLRPVLSALPVGQLADLIPDEAGPLKGLVGALSSLAPRVVVTLGMAESSVDTVPPIDLPEFDAGDADMASPTEVGGGDGGAGGVGGDPGSTGVDTGAPAGDAPDAQGAVDDLPEAMPVSASPGLPALNSIPGMLLFGGIALAAAVGSYFRKLGLLALGAGAPCPHGLDSGLPDLRKM
ncbi:choice-of-anchor P family protein [Nocardioides sp. AE5]|uniref:choice-of-anchor P family protein n=1 Tax=Nocardioides sp. AE5 TaxID=2962573 RepID=UPI002882071C|nr:choice-of-anchor P family protein [Nocardioides sp. AE5]MDT0202245.1 choice-of-anchor P family protein [Nocardioides sp. AE5]